MRVSWPSQAAKSAGLFVSISTDIHDFTSSLTLGKATEGYSHCMPAGCMAHIHMQHALKLLPVLNLNNPVECCAAGEPGRIHGVHASWQRGGLPGGTDAVPHERVESPRRQRGGSRLGF